MRYIIKVAASCFLLLIIIGAKAEHNKDIDNLELSESSILESYIQEIYESLGLVHEKPSYVVFRKAIVGYLNLKNENKLSASTKITIVDFSLPSNFKRLWIIDLDEMKILHHALVAHGRNSGNIYAETFSNINNSYKSSLGFYVTGEQYYGKHGLSMRLIGSDKGFNDNALRRAIVLHGADYVSDDFIKKNGRLGRSLGCPAVPIELTNDIINLTSDGTCFFVYKPDEQYESLGLFLNEVSAAKYLTAMINSIVNVS